VPKLSVAEVRYVIGGMETNLLAEVLLWRTETSSRQTATAAN